MGRRGRHCIMFGRHGSRPEVDPNVCARRSEDGVAGGAVDVVGDDQFDVETEVCPSFVGVVSLAITLMEYGVRGEH